MMTWSILGLVVALQAPTVVNTIADEQISDRSEHSPRIIAYYNHNTTPELLNAEHHPYTHYILAFLIPDDAGGVKPSEALEKVLASADLIQRIQKAGKLVMVAVGGGSLRKEDWLAMGENADAVAESIAHVVEKYDLDGVDLDIEAVPFHREDKFRPYAEAVIKLTRAISKRLPGTMLSHAPQPPYLCKPGSVSCPKDSLYAYILKEVGDEISWLNMQYYSNPPVTSSIADELASYRSIVSGWEGFPGLPPHKLVVGKPYESQINGFLDRESLLKEILLPLTTQYGDSFGGFMAWQYRYDPEGLWVEDVRQVFEQKGPGTTD